jgi:glycosyltransferase involved in cell wall biosynthesis
VNVLITRQADNDPGGISNYFAILKNRFLINAEYVAVGRRVDEKGLTRTLRRLIIDYARFLKVLRNEPIDLVHINISLNTKGVLRDGIFIVLSKMFRKKILVFFHGWDKSFEKKLEGIFLWLFKRIYLSSKAFIVLAADFKKQLMRWGFRQPIFIESTLVDDDLTSGFDIYKSIDKRINEKDKKILFLARIIKEKGIYETIDAIALLQKKYSNISLIVAGEGDERANVGNYVHRNNIQNIIFTGYVTGEKKRNIFEDAYIYCLPSYQEGMPTSLLEALSFGLPIITQPVGGIVDFFENGKNGFITEGRKSALIAKYLEKLILEKDLYRQISLSNYHLGKERYLASEGVKRIEKIYRQVQ